MKRLASTFMSAVHVRDAVDSKERVLRRPNHPRIYACALALVFGLFPAQAWAQSGEDVANIEDALMGQIGSFSNELIELAPMTSAGSPVPGRYQAMRGVGNNIFNDILARVGIVPGATDPKNLASAEGFLEYVDDSQVVNKGGKRATFGYFVRTREGASRSTIDENYSTRMIEFFILFSYDWIPVGDSIRYAFEVFLFGPTQATGCLVGSPNEPVPREQDIENPPRLIAGFAVGAPVTTPRGNRHRLLDEVPIEIARVSNFKGERGHENETVKPGVAEKGKGCLACHSRSEGMPQNTGPFPWIRPGTSKGAMDACLVRTWEATNVTQLPSHMTGGAKFRVTFKSDGTQVVDYQNMESFKGGNDTMKFDGRAMARISTENSVARVEQMGAACATVKITSGSQAIFDFRLPNLGPGGLGTTTGDNAYVCTPNSLEYKTSTANDGHATFSVKLKPVDN